MKGRWILVLLCLLSSVGQLQRVFGVSPSDVILHNTGRGTSIFPESQNPPSSPLQINAQQQEHVQMPLPNLDPISEVNAVREATVNTRDVRVAVRAEESGRKSAVSLPAVIVIDPDQKSAVGEMLAIKNNEKRVFPDQ